MPPPPQQPVILHLLGKCSGSSAHFELPNRPDLFKTNGNKNPYIIINQMHFCSDEADPQDHFPTADSTPYPKLTTNNIVESVEYASFDRMQWTPTVRENQMTNWNLNTDRNAADDDHENYLDYWANDDPTPYLQQQQQQPESKRTRRQAPPAIVRSMGSLNERKFRELSTVGQQLQGEQNYISIYHGRYRKRATVC